MPTVDVVIAVHTELRPTERAVASVVVHTSAPVRVTVVCHGIAADRIANRLGELADHPRVRLQEHRDGLHSAAGPFNAGLDIATAPFTAVLGSDDELEPHAIDSWLRTQRQGDADIVIPRLRLASGIRVGTPPTRPFRCHDMHPVKDRLAYRTAQLGLVSREAFPQLRFTVGLATGEDIDYGLQLWFSGRRISYDRSGPAYLVHDEADTGRITSEVRSAQDELGFLDSILDSAWIRALDDSARVSVAVKLIRSHVLPAVNTRIRLGITRDLPVLAAAARRILTFSPSAALRLSQRDAHILSALNNDDVEAVTRHVMVRTDYKRPSNVIASSQPYLLARDAPLRFLAAAALNR